MAAKALSAGEFLRKQESLPVIDVRSPAEFNYGHIPGAINIPLFTDEERAIIGKTYKRAGKRNAVIEGLGLVGPKLKSFVKAALALGTDEVLIHCWRGGMRSGSFAWLLETAGLKTWTLKGGYKAYRNFLLQEFEKPVKLLVLGGETGSGKTLILQELKDSGEQVIDLEALAHHKGSAFGSFGQVPQPTVEQFENDLFKVWSALDNERPVWVEDEAHAIGRVYIPSAIWNKMKQAPIIRVNVPKHERVRQLLEEYGSIDPGALEQAIEKIRKRLGGQHATQAIEAVKANRLAEAIDITLAYYDKAYNFNHHKRNFINVYQVECSRHDPQLNAQLVQSFASTLQLQPY